MVTEVTTPRSDLAERLLETALRRT